MHRLAPPAVLLLVTGLLLAYGRFSWSWVAGPVASLIVWGLDRKAHEPSAPAPKHAARRTDPAPVD